MNIKKSILIRVRIAFLFVMLFGLAISARTGYIQIAQGDEWRKMREQIATDYRRVKATRGSIYSDNGSLLATSLPFYKVAFDATIAREDVFNKGLDSLSLMLSRFYQDKSAQEYKRMLLDARKSDKKYIVINRRQIDYQQKERMTTWPIFREGRLRGGVIFEKTDVRHHPFNNLSRRTIGFVNENEHGAGLEYSFNEYLAGQDGYSHYEKIAGGVWKPVFDADNVKAVDGYDIQTTLDINLQDVAETALHRAMKQHNADDGLVVVMEVKTGEVKAISNLSSDGKGNFYEGYNFAAGSLFEPGSTFKLVTMLALLQETNLSLTDSIDTGNGEHLFYGIKVRDHEEHGLGKVTIKEAFEHSSNVAMAKLTDRYFKANPQRFMEIVDNLKLTQPLGIQIKGEPAPVFHRPGEKGWSGISLPWMAFGYGIEMTPLQTLTLYNAVANDGKMIKPVFVKQIKKTDVVEKEFKTEVINRKIASDETLKKIRMLLEGVVLEGTAKGIRNPNYSIAGKTGTAQLLENGRHAQRYLTSFVGYFPANEPKYSAIVMIKNPRGWRQYGSNVAAPVFKEIADNIYARDLQLHRPMEGRKFAEIGVFPVIQAGHQQDLTLLCNELGVSNHSATEEEWVRARRNGNSVDWIANLDGKGIMPDVKGMTLRDALYLLEQAGIDVRYDGEGRVVTQSITPGTRISGANRVYLTLDGWLN